MKPTEIAERQFKVWRLYSQGFSNVDIAARLDVSAKTVSRDMQELRSDAMRWFDTLPEGEMQICQRKNLSTMEQVICELSEIKEKTKSDYVKVRALEQIAKTARMHYDMMSSRNLLTTRKQVLSELRFKAISGERNMPSMDVQLYNPDE